MATRTLNVQITGDARNINRVLDQTESRTKRWGGAMAKGFAVAGAAAAGGLALGLKKSAEAAIESEKSQARLVQQLRASGISWAAHRQQIDDVIQRHSKLSGLDDEDLQDSFTNIVRVTGDVNEALRLNAIAADIARARGMDVAKAGELVGKVAGGNIGILSRYGFVVKDGATAQEALASLQQKFAGQAAAYGKTTAGSLDRASVASENLSEIVGTKLTPWLAKGATALVDLVDKAGKLGGPIRTATGAVREAYDDVVGAVRRFMVRNRQDINAVIDTFKNLARFARDVFGVVVDVIRPVLPHTRRILEGVIQVIRGLVRIVTGIINGDWSRAWSGAKDVVSGALKALRGVITGSWAFLKAAVRELGGRIIKGLGDALSGLGNAIKNAVISGVKKGVGAATGAVGDVLGALNPFGDGIGRLAKGIGDGVGRSMDITGLGGTGGLRGADPDLGPFAAIGRRFGLGVTSGIRPGDTTLSGNVSWHSSGDAIDMAGPMSGMRRYAGFLYNRFGGQLRELISPWSELGIKDGRPYRYSGAIQAQHSGANAHVHVAYTGPFGDGIGQAARAARAAGFRGRNLQTAVAIAGPESRYRNNARLVTGAEDSRGMWQINTYAHPWAKRLNLSNPFVAARAAYRVFREAGGFGPWTAYSSGSYRAYMDNAQRAIAGLDGGGGRGRAGGGAGSGNRAVGGGGGSGSVTGSGNTAAGFGDTRRGGSSGALVGPNARLGLEGELARVGVARARAEAKDDVRGLIKAMVDERALKRRRLKAIRKVLRRRITKARRIRLLQEEATLVGEIGDLTDSIKEYRADVKGGATTITRADELDAGVDTNAPTPEPTASGGGASDVQASIDALAAELRASRQFAERVQQTENFQLKKYLADVLSGQIVGYGVVGKSFTPGTGVEYAY